MTLETSVSIICAVLGVVCYIVLKVSEKNVYLKYKVQKAWGGDGNVL